MMALVLWTGCASQPPPEPQNASAANEPATAEAPQPRSNNEPIEPALATTTNASSQIQPSERAPLAPVTPMQLSDGQILKVTNAVDTGEIAQAKLAKEKAKRAEVKSFANHMISEHGKAKDQGSQAAAKSNIEPADSPLAMELSSKGEQTLAQLKQTESQNFDQAYIDAQVKQHAEVLGHIEEHLLPSASDPALKAQLEKARVMVSKHLNQAKEIQAKLEGSSAAATP
jgi:putative membrane protein